MKNKKLIICFLGNASTVHMIKWAGFLSGNGHDVHLFSFENPETQDLKGINMHIIDRKKYLGLKPINFLMNLPSNLSQLKKLIKEIKPGIIHAHYVSSYGIIASLLKFRPFVVTVWGSDVLVAPKNFFPLKLAIKYAFSKADLITCDAEHMKEAMIKLGVNESKIKIINFGVDTKRFMPGPKSEEIKERLGFSNNKLIISLKWPDPISDYETLIKAAILVLKKNPESRFIILGPTSFPSYLKELKNIVNKLGINNEFKFLGNVSYDKVPEYLKTSDIYVSTSLSDAGLSSATAEAMSCGLPVIITDFGDNKKWVENNKNGFLFETKDYKRLAEKITYLLNNENIGKEFGEISRRIIREKNDYYNEMAKMEKLYFGLINK
ncbi:glycosyltransferase family 4 protein [Patescibacteria group bacterium]|nr:glycosyltransferase family 4 protein [Patescibacteria group bacterium]